MCRVNLARIMLRKAEFVEAQVVLEEALENAKQTEFQDVVDVTKLIAQVKMLCLRCQRCLILHTFWKGC